MQKYREHKRINYHTSEHNQGQTARSEGISNNEMEIPRSDNVAQAKAIELPKVNNLPFHLELQYNKDGVFIDKYADWLSETANNFGKIQNSRDRLESGRGTFNKMDAESILASKSYLLMKLTEWDGKKGKMNAVTDLYGSYVEKDESLKSCSGFMKWAKKNYHLWRAYRNAPGKVSLEKEKLSCSVDEFIKSALLIDAAMLKIPVEIVADLFKLKRANISKVSRLTELEKKTLGSGVSYAQTQVAFNLAFSRPLFVEEVHIKMGLEPPATVDE